MKRKSELEQATDEARRALYEAFNDRDELAEVVAASFEGPVRFAERLRRTEFGGRGVDPEMSREDYLGQIYGEDARFGDAYSSAYLAAWQSWAPFVRQIQ